MGKRNQYSYSKYLREKKKKKKKAEKLARKHGTVPDELLPAPEALEAAPDLGEKKPGEEE
jgi:hypothetical protein